MTNSDSLARLKHAYARGARIQYSAHDAGYGWIAAQPSWRDDLDYRIHPEDESMQYGPISSALRNHVLGITNKFCPELLAAIRLEIGFLTEEELDACCGGDLFRLFAIEALADEGV